MKISCEIIKDLLPLYQDGVCSDESKKVIEEHIKICENCKAEIESMNGALPSLDIEKNLNEADAVKKISKKWRRGMLKSGLKGIGATLLLVFVICLYLFIAIGFKNSQLFSRDNSFDFDETYVQTPPNFYEKDKRAILNNSPKGNSIEINIQDKPSILENVDELTSLIPNNEFYVIPNLDENLFEYTTLFYRESPIVNESLIPDFNDYIDYAEVGNEKFLLYDLNLEDENNLYTNFGGMFYEIREEYKSEKDLIKTNVISFKNDFTDLEAEMYIEEYMKSAPLSDKKVKPKKIESELFEQAYIVKQNTGIFDLPIYYFFGFNKLSEPIKYYDFDANKEIITDANKNSLEKSFVHDVFRAESFPMLGIDEDLKLFPQFRLSENDKKLIIDESELIEMIEQMKK